MSNDFVPTEGQQVWYDANVYHGSVRQPAIRAKVIAVKKRVQIEFVTPDGWVVGNTVTRRWVERRSLRYMPRNEEL